MIESIFTIVSSTPYVWKLLKCLCLKFLLKFYPQISKKYWYCSNLRCMNKLEWSGLALKIIFKGRILLFCSGSSRKGLWLKHNPCLMVNNNYCFSTKSMVKVSTICILKKVSLENMNNVFALFFLCFHIWDRIFAKKPNELSPSTFVDYLCEGKW